MLTEENIVEINTILKLCGIARMTDSEIDYLNAIGTTITDDCDKYKTAQTIILDRLRNKTCNGNSMSRLYHLASADGCSLKEKEPEKPAATVMMLGGRLG